MSDDTLSQLVAEAIARNIAPVVRWLYGTFASVIVGTIFVVGMVYDVRSSIEDAKREANNASEGVKDLRAVVNGHDRAITILETKADNKARP